VQYEITAPNQGHTGIIAGVAFIAGRAIVEDPPPGAVEYFRRHGYRIESASGGPPESKPTARTRSRGRPAPPADNGG
jgi:hypothetical protein